jgi:hypothetical protein
MTDESIVQHIADALIEHYGATAAVEIAETLASVTSGSGTQFWRTNKPLDARQPSPPAPELVEGCGGHNPADRSALGPGGFDRRAIERVVGASAASG